MRSAQALQSPTHARDAYSTEAICARILERHRDRVSVRKPHLATANLAKIIEAVLRLSSRQGFHETSLRDLAKDSGLSMGGLYSYFDNKNTLLVMILTEVAETVEAVLRDVPEGLPEKPVEHLRWLIETHIRLTEAMQPWFVFAYMEAKGFPAPARNLATESELTTERIFSDVLDRGVAQGAFAIENVTLTASLIKPLLQDWYVKRAKYRKRGTPIQTYIDGVITFVERAIVKA
ncbi:TetR/AcrR family transcriptional regulator [Methylobacterium sp. J-043]|uniref:TetR/AcrR family transcriptional regulator n=1 Tax=Methylorubrum TaxID=2282523 RepID=UPI00209E2C2F|nr:MULTISPECIES: TetR/AcrR family transcriptional regulator [Methylorubrum]MCJ2030607.1 TetR/AcrR family transcriptional regulator [Methylobacterium sp. J-043]MCP1550293.1 AcrR family transcriptional regulator [Methylorubrum zatmanii]MCP1553094.1 AcrR family transcriptional regulator [Methylorubrum extorquens]MCP1580596.1 AcrR family transcriptional regulator [Methylorubrum extorquens]